MSDRPITASHYDLRRGAMWMLGSLVGFTGMALLVKHLGSTRGVSGWWSLLFRAAVGMLVVWGLYGPRKQVSFKRAATGRMIQRLQAERIPDLTMDPMYRQPRKVLIPFAQSRIEHSSVRDLHRLPVIR